MVEIEVKSFVDLNFKLQELFTRKPNLLESNAGRLCQRTPVNTIASIALNNKKSQQEIEKIFRKSRFKTPEELTSPYIFIQNVNIVVRCENGDHDQTKFVAKKVLLKRGVGKPAGISIGDNETAGLLLDVCDGYSPQDRMLAVRIWNNSTVEGADNPYSCPMDSDRWPIDPFADHDNLRQEIGGVIHEAFNKEIEGHQNLLETFIQACEKRKIPLDADRFYFTNYE